MGELESTPLEQKDILRVERFTGGGGGRGRRSGRISRKQGVQTGSKTSTRASHWNIKQFCQMLRPPFLWVGPGATRVPLLFLFELSSDAVKLPNRGSRVLQGLTGPTRKLDFI